MKRVLLGGLALLALGAGWALWALRPGPEIQVVVPRGLPAARVGALLAEKGVLRFALPFRILARLNKLDRKLKPGTYMLRQGMSSLEALYTIHKGGFDFVRVIIPEGWRASQIAERLQELGVTQGDAFLERVERSGWEGYLFPTTYYLSLGMSPTRVASLMHDQFLRRTGPALRGPLPIGLSAEQVVVLASIVEREAVLPHERPIIAKVYLNRYYKRWRLEADPTVQYALGYWKKALTYKDLEVASPYNTYQNRGLPPGPIASPSLDSVLAVLSPAQSDAMYFVADNSGGHVFHKTYEDHLKASAKAKRERQLLKRRQKAQKEAAILDR